MGILNFCGWESGNGIEAQATAGTFEVQTTVKRTGTYALRCNPVTTGAGYHTLGNSQSQGLHTAFSASNLFVSFYFRYATKPAAAYEPIFVAISSTTSIWLSITSGGVLTLRNSALTLIATGTAVLVADTWYRIDVNVNDTANTQEVKVDGTVDISSTEATSSSFLLVRFGKVLNTNSQTVDFFYDDACWADDAYPGAGECKIAVPIGAGAAAGWTNGTGTTFAEVDEIPPNTTDYIQAAATEDNADHTFDMQTAATTGVTGTIGAVKTMVSALTESVAGASTVAHRRLFNSTAFELTALGLTTTYQTLFKVDVTDPSAGGGAITIADFDSIEVGMAANTIAQTQRFTVAYLTIWSDGVVAGATAIKDIIGGGVVPFAR